MGKLRHQSQHFKLLPTPALLWFSFPCSIYSTLLLFLEWLIFKGKSQNQRAVKADPQIKPPQAKLHNVAL
jgi:hypothetical protein